MSAETFPPRIWVDANQDWDSAPFPEGVSQRCYVCMDSETQELDDLLPEFIDENEKLRERVKELILERAKLAHEEMMFQREYDRLRERVKFLEGLPEKAFRCGFRDGGDGYQEDGLQADVDELWNESDIKAALERKDDDA